LWVHVDDNAVAVNEPVGGKHCLEFGWWTVVE
jgi:hypothetical protein